jgi:hypothetical protein
MDAIFCPAGGSFQNEIIWRRTGSHNSRRSFGPIHDVIYVYNKSIDYKFNIVRRPYMKGHVESRYKRQPDGRMKFSSGGNVLTGAGIRGGDSGNRWRGFDPTGKRVLLSCMMIDWISATMRFKHAIGAHRGALRPRSYQTAIDRCFDARLDNTDRNARIAA